MNITAALLTRLKCFPESVVMSGWVIGRVDFVLLRYSNLTRSNSLLKHPVYDDS